MTINPEYLTFPFFGVKQTHKKKKEKDGIYYSVE